MILETEEEIEEIKEEHSVELGRSIAEIAKLTGISHAHVSNVLNGRSEPSLSIAKAIADSCGITTDQLYEHIQGKTNNIEYKGGKKLSETEIESIKKDKGKMTTREAGKKYNISAETISRIWKKKNPEIVFRVSSPTEGE